jgi:urate oxidase
VDLSAHFSTLQDVIVDSFKNSQELMSSVSAAVAGTLTTESFTGSLATHFNTHGEHVQTITSTLDSKLDALSLKINDQLQGVSSLAE